MDRVFEARLIECLSALEKNEPIEQILARYPEDAPRLRPILRIAVALPDLVMEPRPEAQEVSRRQLLAAALKTAPSGRRSPRRPGRRFPILEMMGVAILVCSVSAMLLAISGSALPGTPLYGMKLVVEGARLVLATQDDARATLERQFNQERIDEIKALLPQGGQAEAAFEGTIEEVQPDVWQISGLAVTITSSTQIIGDPQVGLTAQVRGQVIGDNFLADSIAVEQAAEPALESTATYEHEGSPTSHPTLTPSPTPTRLPTRTPTPKPVIPFAATPTEDDDTDDSPGDGNGSENDNSGDDDNSGHGGDGGDEGDD